MILVYLVTVLINVLLVNLVFIYTKVNVDQNAPLMDLKLTIVLIHVLNVLLNIVSVVIKANVINVKKDFNFRM
jgi:hypothetical protein